MNRHASLDLETLSTQPNAAIVQIGIAVFNMDAPIFEAVLSHFTARIDLACYSFDIADNHIDGKTLKWWIQQPNVTDLASNEAVDFLEALENFESWVSNQPEIDAWWGNGSSFDNVIFRNFLGPYLSEKVLYYRKDRDMRTLIDLATRCGWKHNFVNERPHNALYDAIHQARLIHSAFNYIRRGPWANT